VAWSWKAGGNKNTFNVDDVGYASAAAAGLTGGSITPTGASVGTKQGFSIIKWTATNGAATISHGLENPPTFIVVKDMDSAAFWQVYHSSLGNTKAINLNSTNGESTQTNHWNNTSPTSTTFSVGVNSNYLTDDHIAYLWHDVPGMFKTGKYVNNASADGPYIELGFKPAIVILKCTGSGTNWRIADNTRNPFNNGSTTEWLRPSTGDAKSDERAVDFVSSGFKIRSTAGGDINQNSNAGNITYVYAAWAEAPEFNLYGGQSNAR